MTAARHQVRTVLRPERQPLVGYLALSVFGHGSIVIAALLVSVIGRGCSPRTPILDLDRSMEVSMVVLPKSDSRMPDRAARAPVPQGKPPAPQPEAPTVAPPPKESDLVVHSKPDPKPKQDGEQAQPAPKAGLDEDRRREELMEQMRRQELLDQLLDAPTGPVDRNATDPNSDSTESIQATGAGNRGDPEYAKYISQVRQIFVQHFNPLPSIRDANPGITAKVSVWVDPSSGTILRWEVSSSSGVPAFDAAAERAVQSVGSIPLPPEKFRALLAEAYVVNFN